MNTLRTLLIIFLLVVLSGCGFYRVPLLKSDYYYLNPDKDLTAVGRAILVELDNNSSNPEISTDVTEALFQAIQKKQIFGLSVVRQNDPAWRGLQLDLDTPYTLKQLSTIRKTFRCDAVLIGTVTEYRPYPHMTIALRLKLLDLKDGQLLWALEQIWDTADKTTEYRIKKYFSHRMRSGFAPLREQLVVVSSIKFIKFAAYEVAETLRHKR